MKRGCESHSGSPQGPFESLEVEIRESEYERQPGIKDHIAGGANIRHSSLPKPCPSQVQGHTLGGIVEIFTRLSAYTFPSILRFTLIRENRILELYALKLISKNSVSKKR